MGTVGNYHEDFDTCYTYGLIDYLCIVGGNLAVEADKGSSGSS